MALTAFSRYQEKVTWGFWTHWPTFRKSTLSLAGMKRAPASWAVRTAASPEDQWFKADFQMPEHGFDLENAIRRLIDHALAQSDGNVSAAARRLGVTRDYLRYRLSGQKPGSASGE